MKVLVACEESQRVCIAFRERGHEAYSCDLEDCSGGHPEWHIKQDVIPLLQGDCEFSTCDGVRHFVAGHWDLIIAHPPCTYLSSAGSMRLFSIDSSGEKWINADRYEKMKKAAKFFYEFLAANAAKICVENPAPMKICELPKYSQIIQPYMFGDPYTKRTCLWLKGLPPLAETNSVKPIARWVNTGFGHTTRTQLVGLKTSAKERSKTFPGIAKAMAEQWG